MAETKKPTKTQPAAKANTQYITLVTFDNHLGDRGSYHCGPFNTKEDARKAAADELFSVLSNWDCVLEGNTLDYDMIDKPHPFKGKTVSDATKNLLATKDDSFEAYTTRDDWCEAKAVKL